MIIKNHYFLFDHWRIFYYASAALQYPQYEIYTIVFELRYDLFIIYKGPEETLQIYHCVL